MRILPGKYSVHSPFVFNLITKVIEERGAFYCFDDIERIRKRLLQDNRTITYPDPHKKGELKKATIARIVKKEAISPKKGALLFRLANYFKPRNILQVGSSLGLSTLYLSSYATGLNCISIEPLREWASISQWVYEEAARTAVDLHVGEPRELLPGCLQEIKTLDFVFFNNRDEQIDTLGLFSTCMPYANEHTLFVIDGINKNKRMRTVWNEIIRHPEVTVTIDLRTSGLVFLNKKLHKRNYKIYF